MLKKLMLTTAIGALMIGGAMAQTTSARRRRRRPSAERNPSPTGCGRRKSSNAQKPDQWLSSKFSGTDVVGADNQKIGDVTDILFDKNGKIEAYIVSVGGFLGIGAKDVALAPSSVPGDARPKATPSYERLKLSMTKDQLQQAASFEPYNPPVQRQTTGAGGSGRRPGGRPRPATGSGN